MNSPAFCGHILGLVQFSVFGPILTFGAMVEAVTSGTLADLTGRKWLRIFKNLQVRLPNYEKWCSLNMTAPSLTNYQAMKVSGSICTAGWLAIHFAKVRDLNFCATK